MKTTETPAVTPPVRGLARLPVEITEREAEHDAALSRAAVVGATLEQTIHEGYELRLEVLAPASRSQELVQLRGKDVSVAFSNEPFVPAVLGAVHRVRALVTDLEGPVLHELFIRPGALALSNTARKRIFHAKRTTEIVDEVFAAHGGTNAPSYHGLSPSEAREYTVQYEESDWAFVRRLLADEGIALLSEPQTGRLLATGDTRVEALPPVSAPFRPGSGLATVGPFIERITLDAHTVPRRVVVRAFDESNPLVELQGRAGLARSDQAEAADEVYMFEPDAFRSTEAADRRASQLLEELSGDEEQIVLVSSFALPPGTHLEVTGAPIDLPERLLVTRSTTAFHSAGDGQLPVARTTLVTVPLRPYRPRRMPKPVVRGAQTAFVRGAPGQAIDVDPTGRVEVEFRWDRRDARQAGALRRVRIGQAWAGAAHGVSAVPRVGDEVIVTFLNGDPDHPLIVGNVQNGAAPGPLKYPDERAHTVLRTQSTPGSAGYNELRLVDDAGAELVHVRGQRDMEVVALNDSRRFVGGNDHQRVEKDQQVVVMGQQQCVVTQGGSRLSKSDDWMCNGPIDICCTVWTLSADERHDDCGTWTSKAKSHSFTSGTFEVTAELIDLQAPDVVLSDGSASITISGGKILLTADGASIEITPGVITAIAGLIDLNP